MHGHLSVHAEGIRFPIWTLYSTPRNFFSRQFDLFRHVQMQPAGIIFACTPVSRIRTSIEWGRTHIRCHGVHHSIYMHEVESNKLVPTKNSDYIYQNFQDPPISFMSNSFLPFEQHAEPWRGKLAREYLTQLVVFATTLGNWLLVPTWHTQGAC